MQDTDHSAPAIKDERARIAMVSEDPRLGVVVIDCKFHGLNTELITYIGLKGASKASHREVRSVAIFHDNNTGVTIAVLSIGTSQVLARKPAVDSELASDWISESIPATNVGMELAGKLGWTIF